MTTPTQNRSTNPLVLNSKLVNNTLVEYHSPCANFKLENEAFIESINKPIDKNSKLENNALVEYHSPFANFKFGK